MPATILKVDFTKRCLVECESIPKITSWRCDCCNKQFKHVEGATNNVKHIVLSKQMKNNSSVDYKLCQFCAVQIGDLFKNEGD